MQILQKVLLAILLLAAPLAGVSSAQDQKLTTFILFRHAETVDDGTRDPGLSEVGRTRAARLAGHLKAADITAVYSTAFKRTTGTARPSAEWRGLEIRDYDPFNPNALHSILSRERGGTVLIAGHSNTTPSFVNALIGEQKYVQLADSDYSNIFIVTVTEIGSGSLVHLNY